MHKNGLVNTYMHLSKLNSNISKRKILEKDIIGLSDNSGRSLGAHLHFTILDPVGKAFRNPVKKIFLKYIRMAKAIFFPKETCHLGKIQLKSGQKIFLETILHGLSNFI